VLFVCVCVCVWNLSTNETVQATIRSHIHSHHPLFSIIVSAIDYVGYAAGQTDKFQGTGVFSGIKIEREPKTPDGTAVKETTTPAATSAKDVKEKEPALK